MKLIISALLFTVAATAQTYTVTQTSIRAHETFLASDALAGRGSATRDEQIAATYVASQFIAYGIKPAPGMTGYIQSAELAAPELDGHATITAGSVTLQQGADFQIIASSGTSVSGTLSTADFAEAKPAKGAAILLTGTPKDNPLRTYSALSRGGAAIVLMQRDHFPVPILASTAQHPRIGIHVKGGQPWHATATTIALSQQAAQQLATQSGKPIEVHVTPLNKPARYTYNAIGYLPGSDPNAGTLLLTAHLDHLGTHEDGDDKIYNGANDDAAGTTAVLEIAHALATGPQPKRSILFVCYGSEELGGLGSTYFGAHPPVPLTSIIANLEFEMIGAQDPKMPKNTLLLTGWERSNLGPMLKEHGALLGPDPYPEQHFFERSDNYSLALQGVVAHTAAGWGTVPTYHQPNDDLEHLDIPFMTQAIQSLIEPVRWLATSDFKPAWNPGGQPQR